MDKELVERLKRLREALVRKEPFHWTQAETLLTDAIAALSSRTGREAELFIEERPENENEGDK